MNRLFVAAAALLAVMAFAPTALRAADAPVAKPNVVLIFADDK